MKTYYDRIITAKGNIITEQFEEFEYEFDTSGVHRQLSLYNLMEDYQKIVEDIEEKRQRDEEVEAIQRLYFEQQVLNKYPNLGLDKDIFFEAMDRYKSDRMYVNRYYSNSYFSFVRRNNNQFFTKQGEDEIINIDTSNFQIYN